MVRFLLGLDILGGSLRVLRPHPLFLSSLFPFHLDGQLSASSQWFFQLPLPLVLQSLLSASNAMLCLCCSYEASEKYILSGTVVF